MSATTSPQLADQLCDFIAESPTPFHATKNLLDSFVEDGFKHLDEGDDWQFEANSAYVITRNDSSIVALRTGANFRNGIHMLGAQFCAAARERNESCFRRTLEHLRGY